MEFYGISSFPQSNIRSFRQSREKATKTFDNAIIKGLEESWPINLLGKTPSSPTVKVLIEGTLWWFGLIEEEREGFSSIEDWDDDNGGLLP